MNQCKIVAEGCCNHLGQIDVAIEMTKIAKICGADYIKWQKRNPMDCVPKDVQLTPHSNPQHAYGNTYLEHRLNLEFSLDQHRELNLIAKNIGIGYACSVWDIQSAEEIISLDPDFIKLPSAANDNIKLINFVMSNFSKDVHISTGMMTQYERKVLFKLLSKHEDRIVIYHTTSEYPCKFEHLFLREISNLKKEFSRVGYSGHNYGIAADIAALTLGATWIERHFTLDRTAKGTDHAASLEPDGLKRLCRDIQSIEKALAYRNIDMTDAERENRKKLKNNYKNPP